MVVACNSDLDLALEIANNTVAIAREVGNKQSYYEILVEDLFKLRS